MQCCHWLLTLKKKNIYANTDIFVRIARYFVIPAFVRQKLCDVYNEGSKAMARQQKEISLEAWWKERKHLNLQISISIFSLETTSIAKLALSSCWHKCRRQNGNRGLVFWIRSSLCAQIMLYQKLRLPPISITENKWTSLKMKRDVSTNDGTFHWGGKSWMLRQ